jgi:cyanophycinase
MAERTRSRRGRLLLVGGAERRDPGHEVLAHFAALAGGDEARVLVVGAATREPQDVLPDYRRIFQKLGVKQVWTAAFQDRGEGEKPTLLENLEQATAVYFTGGDQLRLTMHVAGTPFGDLLRERHNGGSFLVGGTSAGAVAMGSVMILSGPGGGSVRRADVRMGPGLGFLRDATVDTHFNERGRVPRFLTLFAQNSQVLGIGIDENTALDVRLGDEFRVLGSGAVTVFDGRVSYSNAADAADHDIIALSGVTVHVLPKRFGFDPSEMRLLPPRDG